MLASVVDCHDEELILVLEGSVGCCWIEVFNALRMEFNIIATILWSFPGFCLRFANDFEVTWDDWKPDRNLDLVMNAMVVPEGTYEVCSRTAGANQESINAKWILNITWQMRGIDIHLDANIGKLLSMLGSTLTTMTGDAAAETVEPTPNSDDSEETEYDLYPDKVDGPNKKITTLPEGLPDFVYDASLDPKTRARLIEKEMNEQAKVVQDLKQLGASQNTVDMEERKLAELEATVFHDFRQVRTQLIMAETKWLPFYRWHFQIHFLEWKLSYLIEVCSQGFNW